MVVAARKNAWFGMPEFRLHAAGVLGGLDVVGHGRRLRVLPEHRVVVRGPPGGPHRPECTPCTASVKSPLADQPRGLVGGLPGGVLRNQRTEHVAHRLVQRADCPWYVRSAVYWVTPWASSWPMTSSATVKRRNTSSSPSPKPCAARPSRRYVVVLPVVHRGVEGEPAPSDRHPAEHVEPDACVAPSPAYASSTAASPESGSPSRRTTVPGRVVVPRASVTVRCGERSTEPLMPCVRTRCSCFGAVTTSISRARSVPPRPRGGAPTRRRRRRSRYGGTDGVAAGGGHGAMEPPTTDDGAARSGAAGRLGLRGPAGQSRWRCSTSARAYDSHHCPGRRSAVAGAVAEPGRLHPEQGVEPGRPRGDVRCLSESRTSGLHQVPRQPCPFRETSITKCGSPPIASANRRRTRVPCPPVEVRDVRREALRPVDPGRPQPPAISVNGDPVLVAAVEVHRQPVSGELVHGAVHSRRRSRPRRSQTWICARSSPFDEHDRVRAGHRPDGRPHPRQVGVLGGAAGGVAAAVAVGIA